ncbi:MAG: hypothetical protein GY820_01645, partial [Gammaproteobacteria bacterium]|nr:hypothetical protein [Gammaproteobacteria bacterium]
MMRWTPPVLTGVVMRQTDRAVKLNSVNQQETSIMSDIKRVAIDLAKNVFQVCAVNAHNKVLLNKKLTRKQLLSFLS